MRKKPVLRNCAGVVSSMPFLPYSSADSISNECSYIRSSIMCIFSDAGVGGDTCRKNVQQCFQKVTGRIINTVSWRDEYVCRQTKLTCYDS